MLIFLHHTGTTSKRKLSCSRSIIHKTSKILACAPNLKVTATNSCECSPLMVQPQNPKAPCFHFELFPQHLSTCLIIDSSNYVYVFSTRGRSKPPTLFWDLAPFPTPHSSTTNSSLDFKHLHEMCSTVP